MQTAWVVQRGDAPAFEPLYWRGPQEGWTRKHTEAVRFADRESAEAISSQIAGYTIVAPQTTM